MKKNSEKSRNCVNFGKILSFIIGYYFTLFSFQCLELLSVTSECFIQYIHVVHTVRKKVQKRCPASLSQ